MRASLFASTMPAVALALTAVPCLSAQNTQHAPVTVLGGLPGRPITQGMAINQAGHVAGFSGNSVGENDHAFLAIGGNMMDLGTLPNALGSDATDVNNLDHVVGYSLVLLPPPVGPRQFHAFFWRDGAMTDLGTLPGQIFSKAYAVNAVDQVVGTSGHAFLWDATHGMQDLGTLPGGTNSVAYGINGRGQIVGYSTVNGGTTAHAFLYQNGSMTDLGTLPGGTSSMAHAINNRGDIVGNSTMADGSTHAFLYSHGQMTDLTTMPGATGFPDAYAISDVGEVLGPNRLLKGGQIYDITVNSPPFDVPFFLGHDINNSGIVAGATLGANGHGAYAATLNTNALLAGQANQ